MRLGDAVGSMCTKPAHDGATVAHEVAVESREGATGKCELGGTVVREKWIGVLQECDQDKPVVYPTITIVNAADQYYRSNMGLPEVRDKVEGKDFCKAFLVYPCCKDGKPDEDTDVGENHLFILVRGEHHSFRVEICKIW